MPQLRRDPVGGRWVIVATERAARPNDFEKRARVVEGEFCPFCEGNEDKTPPEILAIRSPGTQPDSPGWTLRVVPNKFPALTAEGGAHRDGPGVYETMSGVGAHEVFIEGPKHVLGPAEQSPESVRDVVWAYRERMLALKQDSRMVFALVFKNVGQSAGASLEHSHSQLICTPVVPKRVGEEMDRCMDFWLSHGRCLICEIVRQEIADGERVVIDGEQFVVITPYASRFPFEMWIIPKVHISHFESTPAEMLGELARALQESLCRLDAALGEPPYNYVLHTTPFNSPEVEHFHWHVEVIPRVTHVAGFEWGTGFYINHVEPRVAAQKLRRALPERVAGAV